MNPNLGSLFRAALPSFPVFLLTISCPPQVPAEHFNSAIRTTLSSNWCNNGKTGSFFNLDLLKIIFEINKYYFTLLNSTLQVSCKLWEGIKSTRAGDHLAAHNHDPTPQVGMVMSIGPAGPLHIQWLKANHVFFFLKTMFGCPLVDPYLFHLILIILASEKPTDNHQVTDRVNRLNRTSKCDHVSWENIEVFSSKWHFDAYPQMLTFHSSL